MRTKPNGVVFLPFGADPHFDKIFGEHISLKEECVIVLESLESFSQAARYIRNLLQLFRRQFVDVLVEWFARFDLVLDAIETSHEQRRKSQIRIRGRIRRAIFNALGFWILAVSRNAD